MTALARDGLARAQFGTNAFLCATATVGAVGLLAGGEGTPPLELLDGSVFSGYLVPALVLLVVVGGSALWATMLTVVRDENVMALAQLARPRTSG